ncbi:hypothetical protein M0R45_011670 [Rubus argutus]|uniref:Uncharacterized protein n=1 Tax=Rubus argutus TaxID=59490 RepID=A0AAW1YC99_RUBAR
MSIALDRIDIATSFGLIFESPPAVEEAVASSSSSIGKNSDASGRSSSDDGEENDEAQSSYKGPLDMMDALEEVLPLRRGISKFYNYKSKSFTSLADASTSSSIKDIAKADNAYNRKRRNLLASNVMWDTNRNFPLRSCRGGISKSSKKTITASRSTLALAVAMNSSESSPSTSDDSNSRSPTSPHPGPWRSLSLADLQQCATSAAAAAVNTTSRFFPSKPNLQS